MKTEYLINMTLMQFVWFAAVLGAADGLTWPGLLLLVIFAAWQLHPERRHKSDLYVLPVAVILGLILDTAWIRLGWIVYTNPGPVPGVAPVWILALWAALALTLNHSLSWLQNRLLLAGCLTALVCPLSYLAGERLGALNITGQTWNWVFGLGLSWSLTLPFLLWLANHVPAYNMTLRRRTDV